MAPSDNLQTPSATVRCDGVPDRLFRHILLEAAPVFSGLKPALLVSVEHCSRTDGRSVACLRHRALEKAMGLSARVLRFSDESALVLFYDRAALIRHLARLDVTDFLARNGYRGGEPLETMLDRLAAAFAASPGTCPHEVGVFLGYPVKDVEGFMARPQEALPLRRTLWRVFAPANESLRLMARIRAARDRAMRILALESDAYRACFMLRGLAN